MGIDFQGTIKTINGNKYLITQGLPGDADGIEYDIGTCRSSTDCDPSDHKTILAVATILR